VVPEENKIHSGWSKNLFKPEFSWRRRTTIKDIIPRRYVRISFFTERIQELHIDDMLKIPKCGYNLSNFLTPIVGLPPYRYPSQQNKISGSSCRKRSMAPSEPKSGEQLAQMAPIAVVANIAIRACGIFGRYATTLSPRFTPRARSSVAIGANLIGENIPR
jgi:hypothetical protein